jgi:colicin import membrane protein
MFQSESVLELESGRRRQLRRLVVVSALAHLALGVAMSVTPRTSRFVLPPAGVVTVDLVSADALPGARPKPRARPKPPVQKVVLPAEPAAPKPAPAKPAPAKPAPEPAPVAQVELDDLLAELSAERQDEAPTRQVAGLAGTATGSAVVDREVAAWLTRVRAHMRRNWILPPGFRTQRLQARVRVRLDEQGNVIGEPQVVTRSGNRHYDETAIRAIAKANPLPAPPEAGEWTIVFDPEDLY